MSGGDMKRGQVQVLWVIIELVLVIVASFGIFFMIDSANDNTLPRQQYAAKELKFTREAIDIYALSAVYYELIVPGYSFDNKTIYGDGNIRVDKAREKYGYDSNLKENAYFKDSPGRITLEIAGGVVLGEVRTESNKLQVGCDPRPFKGKIAFIPTSVETQLLATRITAQSPGFFQATETVQDSNNIKIISDIVNSADAVVVLRESKKAGTAIAQTNEKAGNLGCKLVNSIVDTIQVTHTPLTNTAVVPLSSFKNPDGIEKYLPDDKPGAILTLAITEETHEKLKTAFE